jgi:hypothetical protein
MEQWHSLRSQRLVTQEEDPCYSAGPKRLGGPSPDNRLASPHRSNVASLFFLTVPLDPAGLKNTAHERNSGSAR